METDKKSKQLDPKDAMAAILAGCNGISKKQARRRVDWMIASGTDEQRDCLQSAMDEMESKLPTIFHEADIAVKLRALELAGRMLAKKHRKLGKKPPCDDPIGRSKMLRIASVFYSKKKIDGTFVPLVSHYVTDLEEARGEGLVKVLLVKIEWWGHFAKACSFDRYLAAIELVFKIVKLVL